MRNAASHENRCSWVNMNDPLLVEYHDHEWGVPVHGDNRHLEVLVLSGAQAGLNWSLVLKNEIATDEHSTGSIPTKSRGIPGNELRSCSSIQLSSATG